MKRDDDYIRELLFDYQENEAWILVMPGMTMDSGPEEMRERYHVLMMIDAGLVTYVGNETFRLTNSGQDYIEAIRDEGIWQKTKNAVAETGGSVTLEIIKALALGFLKKQIETRTGISI